MIDKQELDKILREASDFCAEKEERSYYEDWILIIFWMKYLHCIYDEKKKDGKEPFALFENSTFGYFYEHRENERFIEILREGLARFGASIRNNALLFNVLMALNFYQNISRLSHADEEVIKKLLELFCGLDLSGKESFDLFGYAFQYFRHWKYSMNSFRSYIGG